MHFVHPFACYLPQSDAGNSAVRRIDDLLTRSATVSTVVGGYVGFADGVGTLAMFRSLNAISMTPDGSRAVIVRACGVVAVEGAHLLHAPLIDRRLMNIATRCGCLRLHRRLSLPSQGRACQALGVGGSRMERALTPSSTGHDRLSSTPKD